MEERYGIYQSKSTKSWFGGQLSESGEPFAEDGAWAGTWHRTRKAAEAAASVAHQENLDYIENYNKDMGSY